MTADAKNAARTVHHARREIERCVGGRQGLRILDAGAGAGRFSIPLAEAGHRVVHLDLSPRMLDLAAGRAVGVEALAAALKSASFDLTWVTAPVDDRRAYYRHANTE